MPEEYIAKRDPEAATAAERISEMEQCLVLLQNALEEHAGSLPEDASFAAALQTLTRYYESGEWLRDYELDEQGLLPKDLKRGVLAQDTVYDLLDRIRRPG